MRWILGLLLAITGGAQGVLIDRIALVVDRSIIKDSDIEKNIRVTEFLNGEPLSLGQAERKKAANQLIEQIFLRNEIRLGAYTRATEEQAAQQLTALIKDRFTTSAALERALERYGLDKEKLLDQFRWQLTVLGFIEARFKPGVVISDADVDNYYRTHLAALRKQDPKGSEEDLRAKARDILTEEQVNRLFFTWLDERRKSAQISFHEEGLT